MKIHAYFDSMSDASKALKALIEKGYTGAHLDMSGIHDYEYSKELSVDDLGNNSGMSALVVKYGGNLLESNEVPIHVGGTSMDDCRFICTKLIVNTDDSKKNDIEKIISDNEGRIFPSFIE
jgi:hypothetical protein